MADERTGISRSISPSIFRAYDIRGIVDQELTPAILQDIGRAIGTVAGNNGIKTLVVGRDGRQSSASYAESVINGLINTGCSVIDIGQVPTPVLYFATYHAGTRAGVMITGSHNPANYNGLKIVLNGEPLAEQQLEELGELARHGVFAQGQGARWSMNVVDDYVERLVTDNRLQRPFKVVVDCGSGVEGDLAPNVLRKLGCDVQELYCQVDGRFPFHHPDPSRPENLAALRTAVEKSGADIGLAFDGDGDRLGIVDNAGHIIWPDRLMMLFAKDLLSRQPGAEIIFDVKCSRNLEKVILQHGGRPLMWKSGHSLLRRKMNERGALLAGELSGHFFFKERWFGFDDGLYAAMRLLEVLSAEHKTSAEIFAELPHAVSTPELSIPMPDETRAAFIAKFVQQSHFAEGTITTIDGMRVDFADGWGLVRASNTMPCLTLRFEAVSSTALQRIQKLFEAQLKAIDPQLGFAFDAGNFSN